MQNRFSAGSFDVAVVGAGHAGIEAALSAARLGCSVVIFTMTPDCIANMPCNPSIGGSAKGHLVREIDALGGEMARAADRCTLQSRFLGRSKGPAVHSPRVQADRRKYSSVIKQTLEHQSNLQIKQGEIVDLVVDDGHVSGLVTRLGAVYDAKCIVLSTGTYLSSRIHVGGVSFESGPDGLSSSLFLSERLRSLGISLRRFKTGTPPRIHRRSVNLSRFEPQSGDEPPRPLSFFPETEIVNSEMCYIAYTNSETHNIIRENMHRSPLFSGQIEGTGARYCPSIEDKVVRFADKPRHQLFLEPTGADTEELYLQGMSSSLPEDVQTSVVRSIPGLENAEFMRPAYAIEYDCCDPLQLRPTLEFKEISGLFAAGQICGTSGYEEAACLGLVAGINAAKKVQQQPPLVLSRSSSYIGVLIDDLVTKGVQDPYRIMTSRSEFRLLLRQDNADARLTPIGFEIGLVSAKKHSAFLEKQQMIKDEIKRLKSTTVSPSAALNDMIVSRETSAIYSGVKLSELLKRPQISYADLKPFDPSRPCLPDDVCEEAEIVIKYEGYIALQEASARELKRLEERILSPDIDYGSISGLRLEAKEKLSRVKPETVGQASRISGVNPADISVLLIWLSRQCI